MNQALGSPIPAPGRLLDRPELLALVRELASHPEWWAGDLNTTSEQRTYAALHRGEHLDVWAIAWRPENDTGWHDHDTSSGAVHVVDGLLTESVLHIGGAEVFNAYTAGSDFSFAPTHIHRLTCDRGRALSIHAYSPPLSRLGQYTVDEAGVLLRVTVSDADELRPLDVASPAVHA